MLGHIFQSRYRVESSLAEGRDWQSWTVRDIINNRPSLLFIYPSDPEGKSLDRSSVAWRLARYREILGKHIPQVRLAYDPQGLTLLCELPEGAKVMAEDESLPDFMAEMLEQDRLVCLREGLSPPLADRRLVWKSKGGAPLYFPPAVFDDPGRPEPLREPLNSYSPVSEEDHVLPEAAIEALELAVASYRTGEASILRVRAGRPGGLGTWRLALESWLRKNGGRGLADPGAPIYFLEDLARPSCLLSGVWAKLASGSAALLILDGESLDADPAFALRSSEIFDELETLHRFEIHLPAIPKVLPTQPVPELDPEERSFLELLSLLDEPVPLDFLLELLQVEESDFHPLLNALEGARTLAVKFGPIEGKRRGLCISVAHPELKMRIRKGIETDRERELHLLILGLLDHRKRDSLVDAVCRFHHLHGAGRDETMLREGIQVFSRLRERNFDLAAMSIADHMLEGDRQDLSPTELRELILFLGDQRKRRDDLQGAEEVYRDGLVSLTGREDFLDELQRGRRPRLARRVDAELLSALSALVRAQAEIGEVRGEFARAGSILEGLLDAYSESLAARERGILYNELAWILYRRGDHQEAVERCETALRLFDATEQPAELGQTFNTLGAAQWALGNWREAEAYYQKALNLREKAGDETRIAASLNNLGNLYRMLEQLPKAIEYFQRSMEIKRRQGNEAGYLISLYNVALSSFEMNDIKTARRQGDECLELNGKVGNIQLGAELLGLLGEIDLVEGRYESARERLEEALRVCREIEARTELASMYRRLAGVHLAREDMDAASRVIEDGLAEARRVGSRFEEAQILVYRGECESRLDRVSRAIKSLGEAADILSVLDKMEWLARVYSRMGLILLEAGQEERAQEQLQQASGIIERRRITVPMQEWDQLQARLQNRRERLIERLGEQDSRGRLAGFLQVLEALEIGSDARTRAEQVLDQLTVILPSRRAAIFLSDENASLADMERHAVLHGDFPDAGMVAEASQHRMKSPTPFHEDGRIYIPLCRGGRRHGLLFLESEESLDEQTRDYLSTLGKLLAMGLFSQSQSEAWGAAARPKDLGVKTVDSGRSRLVGRGRDLQRILKLIGQVKDLESTVLITGESGTGKEEVAKAIHFGGRRSHRPFMAVNCAALPETLLESQLFGHERGSFTGATHRHIGFFEEASGGTIFLDEIGEMSPSMQAKLLRVLQEREFIRLGGTRTIKTNARVLAATHRKIADEVRAGRFREDLFFRINVISINIAPLREKREDIPLLVDHFLEALAREQGLPLKRVSEEVMQVFLMHPLPGNVRQVSNVLENCVILARSDLIGLEDLPEDFLQQARPQSHSRSLDELAEMLVDSVEYSESEPLERKLLSSVAHHLVGRTGSKLKAAKLLGISRPTLYSRLKSFEDGKNISGKNLRA